MGLKKDIKEIDELLQIFLAKATPYLTGKDSKAILKHLNDQLKLVSDGKPKGLIKRAEKEFGVSLEEQYKAIERSERGGWGVKLKN